MVREYLEFGAMIVGKVTIALYGFALCKVDRQPREEQLVKREPQDQVRKKLLNKV